MAVLQKILQNQELKDLIDKGCVPNKSLILEFPIKHIPESLLFHFISFELRVMSDKGVNGDFAPTGRSTYDIFVYKGGAFCHHFWKRQIYMRKRDSKGRILPNEGLENDKRVGNNPFVPKKGVEGIAPINTPSRGSLKYG